MSSFWVGNYDVGGGVFQTKEEASIQEPGPRSPLNMVSVTFAYAHTGSSTFQRL